MKEEFILLAGKEFFFGWEGKEGFLVGRRVYFAGRGRMVYFVVRGRRVYLAGRRRIFYLAGRFKEKNSLFSWKGKMVYLTGKINEDSTAG